MVYVKYNVPKAIRTLGVGEKGGGGAQTAPARLSRVSSLAKSLRSAQERKVKDRSRCRLTGVATGFTEYDSWTQYSTL